MSEDSFELIVTIVPSGSAHEVITASRRAGAEGGTILPARGTGVHEQTRILGIPIDPAKEVVFTLVPADRTDRVLDAIVAHTELDRPGHGIAFVLPVRRVAGITHRGSSTEQHSD